MNGLDWNLDELVGKVMADLQKKPSESTPAALSETLARDFRAARESVAEKTSVVTLHVAERVVVEETVRRLAENSSIRSWTFLPRVIITPSARDLMKKLGVDVVVAQSGAEVQPTISASNVRASNTSFASRSGQEGASLPSSSAQASLGCVLVATKLPSSESAPRTLLEYLSRNTGFQEQRFDCLKKATLTVAERLNENQVKRAIIVTHDGAIANVWANRKKGVRAVVAYSVEQAKRDIKAADANTLILDPRDLGAYQARLVVDFWVTMK
ncbi:MAG: RpiB/LacA/LacB family sugar-phosphate isomerase [Thermoguttaceae bacterium]